MQCHHALPILLAELGREFPPGRLQFARQFDGPPMHRQPVLPELKYGLARRACFCRGKSRYRRERVDVTASPKLMRQGLRIDHADVGIDRDDAVAELPDSLAREGEHGDGLELVVQQTRMGEDHLQERHLVTRQARRLGAHEGVVGEASVSPLSKWKRTANPLMGLLTGIEECLKHAFNSRSVRKFGRRNTQIALETKVFGPIAQR